VFEEDTIAAVSTAMGSAGIGIVRMSGPKAFEIAQKIFRNGRPFQSLESHRLYYGFIIDPTTNEEIDEVLLALMRAPKTYTKEDVVEINAHGGTLVLLKILDLVTAYGARLAEPGEFTKRAFLNGRIDLTQAEAVNEIIKAKTDSGLKMAMRHLKGGITERIEHIRSNLVTAISRLEVLVDFSDEGIELPQRNEVWVLISKADEDVKRLITEVQTASKFLDGVNIVILGRPNVGKSSLLNVLLGRRRAIVAKIPGTTRDTVEEVTTIGNIPLRVIDTCGVGTPRDEIEAEGLKRTQEAVEQADLVLFVLDGSEGLQKEEEIVKEIQAPVIFVVNKIDLPQKVTMEDLRKVSSGSPLVWISCLTSQGVDSLKDQIEKLVLSTIDIGSEHSVVSGKRQLDRLKVVSASLNRAMEALKGDLSEEFVVFELRVALDALEEITGRSNPDAILDQVFSDFCIGK
jgi:tRNA modification GTPase